MSSTSATLPDEFRRIRLELAREPHHPEGDARMAYVIVAPLDREARLDAEAARDHPDACRVMRMRPGQETEEGLLRRRPGGSWAFHYDLQGGGEDDDPGYRLGDHRFVTGEYITIEEDDGPHTYRVTWVQRL
jgi:hypothetical protein